MKFSMTSSMKLSSMMMSKGTNLLSLYLKPAGGSSSSASSSCKKTDVSATRVSSAWLQRTHWRQFATTVSAAVQYLALVSRHTAAVWCYELFQQRQLSSV
jgi:hypothetical protein